jgi:sulfite exporter TauE/SafE
MNQTRANGLLFIAIALAFCLGSLKYTYGTFDDPGPGMFPAMIATALFVIGVINLFRHHHKRVSANIKNIAIIVASLATFAAVSAYAGMIVGVVALVSVSSVATESFSARRTAMLIAGLILVALGFNYILGMNLPLWK